MKGYLFLGQGEVVKTEEILGIFDLDQVSAAARTRKFLEKNEGSGRVRVLGENIPLSLVVTQEGCILSPISSATLCKRAGDNLLV